MASLKEEERRLRRQQAADEMYKVLASADEVTGEMLVIGLSGELGPGMAGRFGSLIQRHGLYGEAIALAGHPDDRVAFRASWALEWAYEADRERFRPLSGDILATFLSSRNGSVHRIYTKMICDMSRRGIIVFDDREAEKVAEKAFDLLIDPDTKVAVKVWAAEVLFDLSAWLGWVRDHLPDVVRHQMELSPTPAMLNHGNKLLRRIAARK